MFINHRSAEHCDQRCSRLAMSRRLGCSERRSRRRGTVATAPERQASRALRSWVQHRTLRPNEIASSPLLCSRSPLAASIAARRTTRMVERAVILHARTVTPEDYAYTRTIRTESTRGTRRKTWWSICWIPRSRRTALDPGLLRQPPNADHSITHRRHQSAHGLLRPRRRIFRQAGHQGHDAKGGRFSVWPHCPRKRWWRAVRIFPPTPRELCGRKQAAALLSSMKSACLDQADPVEAVS